VFELARPSCLPDLVVVLATTRQLAYLGSIVMLQRLLVKVYAQSSVFTYYIKTAAAVKIAAGALRVLALVSHSIKHLIVLLMMTLKNGMFL
jgi:hypothetical protein